MSQKLPINRTPLGPAELGEAVSRLPADCDGVDWDLLCVASCVWCRGLLWAIGPPDYQLAEFGPKRRRAVRAAIGRWQLAEMAAAQPNRRSVWMAGRISEQNFAGDSGSFREHDCPMLTAAPITHCQCPACREEELCGPPPPSPPRPMSPECSENWAKAEISISDVKPRPRYDWIDRVVRRWIGFRCMELSERGVEVRLDRSGPAPVIHLEVKGLVESLTVVGPPPSAQGEFDAVVAIKLDNMFTWLMARLKVERKGGGKP